MFEPKPGNVFVGTLEYIFVVFPKTLNGKESNNFIKKRSGIKYIVLRFRQQERNQITQFHIYQC
jgi:hypothetical protein